MAWRHAAGYGALTTWGWTILERYEHHDPRPDSGDAVGGSAENTSISSALLLSVAGPVIREGCLVEAMSACGSLFFPAGRMLHSRRGRTEVAGIAFRAGRRSAHCEETIQLPMAFAVCKELGLGCM